MPITRVTVVEAEPFADAAAASSWLARFKRKHDALVQRAADALVELNRVLRAHRAATADPYVREVAESHALTRRVGYGAGYAVADGRFAEAVELPRQSPRRPRRRERAGPQERLAAILSARASLLACEELVLRARLDLDAGRAREAALQARIALEAMLSELSHEVTLRPALAAVSDRRDVVAEAANAALDGEPRDAQRRAVETAVERMEAALARRRPA